MPYDKAHFIAKFEAIPDEKWLHPRYQQPTPKQRILAALNDLP